jgi:glycine betaine/proline transport system substrate-binding protein
MKKILLTLLISVFSIFLIFGSANANKYGTVKIANYDWSSQLVGTKIIGELLKIVGERVEHVPTNAQGAYELLADGEIDLVHEIWENAFSESYEKAKARGGIEELQTYDVITREGWWYPDYVEELCPGMQDWRVLKKCNSVFKDLEISTTHGIIYSGPLSWKNYDNERLKALEIPFKIKHFATAGNIWFELSKAYEEKKPVIVFNWSPNFVNEKYSGKFINLPDYHPKCETDKSWGVNPNFHYDCEHSKKGYIKLAVNENFKKYHPKGYEVVKNINFSTSDINKMSNYVETEGKSIQEAADEWMKNHKSKWSEWIK